MLRASHHCNARRMPLLLERASAGRCSECYTCRSLPPQAHPSGPADVLRGGSVPGRVTQSAGGVARNVAEALALLLKTAGAGAGASGGQLALPLLVSAVGDDLAGQALLQHWKSLG